ncbi:retrovirus-related pol polyprotein from transposon TNT 1-94, partial [Tanacetum coccineum]
MPCPCTKCLNHIEHKVEEVQFHLFRNGIDLSYKNWTRDGEKDEPSISAPEPVNATTEFVHDTDFASDIPTDGPTKIIDGISADGVHLNTGNRQHSVWLVLTVIHNPGNDIDVFLEPLVDDLHTLFETGVDTYDVSTKDNCNLRAVVLWTINDYLALGTLCGCPYSGFKGIHCENQITDFDLAKDIRIENIVVNLDCISDNNNADSYNTSQISTFEEIDYDSPEPPKSLLK